MSVTLEAQTGKPAGQPASSATLQALCQRALKESESRNDLLQRLASVAQKVLSADFVAHVQVQGQQSELQGLLHPEGGLNESHQALLKSCGRQACQKMATQVARIGNPPNQLVVSVPILQPLGAYDSIVAVLSSPQTTPDILVAVMELVVTHISLWDARQVTGRVEEMADAATATLDLVSRLQSCDNVHEAGRKLLDELGEFLDVSRLALVRRRDGEQFDGELIATSQQVQVNDETRQLLEAVAAEVLVRGEVSIWPAEQATEQHSLLTLQQLGKKSQQACVYALPLRESPMRLWGVLIVWGDQSIVDPPDLRRFLESSQEAIARSLLAVSRMEKNWLHRKWDDLAQFCKQSKGKIAAGVLAAIVFIMMIPVPYWIECDCVVQPVVRRYVASPFDGKLDRALVEPGDVVATGDLLATLDGREIRWEQAGVLAELQRARKERDAHLATQEYSDAEVSKYEMERLQVKSDLLSHRGENLEIRSPIDGIVIAGDLKKTEGAPLQVGQTMFEIAPLQQMSVEIQVPEEEIAYVGESMPLEVVLDAYPNREWNGELTSVQPRAEIVDDVNAFVSEVTFDNEKELLRPGMRGRAWVRSDARMLGWTIFHHAWEKLLMWLGL